MCTHARWVVFCVPVCLPFSLHATYEILVSAGDVVLVTGSEGELTRPDNFLESGRRREFPTVVVMATDARIHFAQGSNIQTCAHQQEY